MSDPINPDHYRSGGIECIDAIRAAMSPEEFRGFLKGQVFKYNWRMGRKGDAAEDSRKAAWYQDRLTQELTVARCADGVSGTRRHQNSLWLRD